MTLNDVVKRIKQYSHRGDKTVTTDIITTDCIMSVMDSRRDVVKRIPKRWFWKDGTDLVVVQGTATYDLATDVIEPITFHYTSSSALYVLKKIDSDREWFATVYEPSAAQGKPSHYREIRKSDGTKQVELFPVPDASYTLEYEYYKNPCTTDLTVADLSTAIPDIPDYAQDALWKGGLYYFLKGFDDSAAQIAKMDYEQSLMALDVLDEADLDSDLQFRFGLGQNTTNSVNSFKVN